MIRKTEKLREVKVRKTWKVAKSWGNSKRATVELSCTIMKKPWIPVCSVLTRDISSVLQLQKSW